MNNRPSPRSKEEWKAHIEPLLSQSLRAASDALTNTPAIQRWLHEASFEAAQGVAQMQGTQAEAMGYMHMMDDLEEHLPALLDAVREATGGCGRLDLHWRPLSPSFSRLHIDFGRDFKVDVFCLLEETTPDAAREVLDTVRAALPKGDPFPNRPNTATGIVAHEGRCLGVRVKEHLAEGRGRRQTITLLPKGRKPIEELNETEAIRQLVTAMGAG